MESRKKKKEESPESEKETEKKENRLAAGMKNWFGKHRQTLCTLLICAMGCGLLVVLLYPYKCWEEGCYNLAFDGIYCEQHRAEKIEESKREFIKENGSPGLLLFIPFAPVFQYNMLASEDNAGDTPSYRYPFSILSPAPAAYIPQVYPPFR